MAANPCSQGMNGSLTTSLHSNPNLRRPQVGLGVSTHLMHEALGRQAAQELSNSNWTHTFGWLR